MTLAYRLRSGHSTDSVNANVALLQELLEGLVDSTPIEPITSLVIDCNGHDLINLGPHLIGSLTTGE